MRLSILISTFLLSLLALAGNPDFIVYRPKYRGAEELVKVATGLFGKSANLAIMSDKIVINAPKKTGEAILHLFAELDHRPQRYLVSTRSLRQKASAGSGMGIHGKGVRIYDEQGTGQVGTSEEVQVLEGSSATVGSGLDRLNISLRSLGANNVRMRVQQLSGGEVATEVDIPIGRWQALGGISQSGSSTNQKILAKESGSNTANSQLEIRVERLKLAP